MYFRKQATIRTECLCACVFIKFELSVILLLCNLVNCRFSSRKKIFRPCFSSVFLFLIFCSRWLMKNQEREEERKRKRNIEKESKKDRDHRFPLYLSISSDSDRNTCRNPRRRRKTANRREREIVKVKYIDRKPRFLRSNFSSIESLLFSIDTTQKSVEIFLLLLLFHIFFFSSSLLLFRCIYSTIITSCHLVGIGNRANRID